MYSIYLISANIEGLIQWKVGLSRHPEKRLKELKTANPNIIGINALYTVNDRAVAYRIEAILKKNLKAFSIGGEWMEQIALTETLFIEYCTLYEDLARVILKKNDFSIY